MKALKFIFDCEPMIIKGHFHQYSRDKMTQQNHYLYDFIKIGDYTINNVVASLDMNLDSYVESEIEISFIKMSGLLSIFMGNKKKEICAIRDVESGTVSKKHKNNSGIKLAAGGCIIMFGMMFMNTLPAIVIGGISTLLLGGFEYFAPCAFIVWLIGVSLSVHMILTCRKNMTQATDAFGDQTHSNITI